MTGKVKWKSIVPKKKQVKINTRNRISLRYCCSIYDILQEFTTNGYDLSKMTVEELQLSSIVPTNAYDSIELEALIYTMETDEQFESRMNIEALYILDIKKNIKQQKDLAKDAEYQTYLTLKKKFENG